MAKSDKKPTKAAKGSKATKSAKATKIPKQLGGVTLPKPLRKSAEAILAEVQKPGTRELLASGAALVVGAMMTARAKRDAAAPAPRSKPPTPAAPGTPGVTRTETDEIVDALSSAARQVMTQIFARKP